MSAIHLYSTSTCCLPAVYVTISVWCPNGGWRCAPNQVEYCDLMTCVSSRRGLLSWVDDIETSTSTIPRHWICLPLLFHNTRCWEAKAPFRVEYWPPTRELESPRASVDATPLNCEHRDAVTICSYSYSSGLIIKVILGSIIYVLLSDKSDK